MPKRKIQLASERFICSICQGLPKDPVMSFCGHTFCSNCIDSHWDEENDRGIYSCPQCAKRFRLRPNPMKTVLSEEHPKKLQLQDAAADLCFAGPEDVACDVCTWRKMKAIKTCLVCLASYCEKHLKHHNESSAFQKHELVDPSKNLHEKVCSHHNEVKESLCHTDQQCISHPCNMAQHSCHEAVPAAAQRNDKQRVVEVSQQDIHQRIQEREKDMMLLQQEMQAINASIDEAVDQIDVCFARMGPNPYLQKRRREMEQQLRSQQQTALRGVKELHEKVEQEITQLERKGEQLAHTEDQRHGNTTVSALIESTASISFETAALRYLEDVSAAVSENRENLQDIMRQTRTNLSLSDTEEEAHLPPQPQPQTREDFLQYSQQIHLDPNTAHSRLFLSDRDKRVTYTRRDQHYPYHPDRFTGSFQVLSRESLTGRCYWEVDYRGTVDVAVANSNTPRSGNSAAGLFGFNDKSWSLVCDSKRFTFLHNNNETPVSVPPSSRVGVYLDHRAGILSFYSITDTMTLIHKVKTTFTQPLHAAIAVFGEGHVAQLVKPQ